MSAIPKPIHTRLAYSLKQLMHKNSVHGQQIINIQTQAASIQAQVTALPAFPATTVAPPGAAGAAYTEAWAADVTAAIGALIASLQDAGVIS